MQTSEAVAVFLFLSCVGLVFLSALMFGIDLVRRLAFKKALPVHRGYRWAQRASFSFALLGVACMLYGYFIEPYWLDVTRVSISSRKLAAGRSLRIAHISDLHCDPKVRLERKLPAAIAAEEPDLIVFTGDSVNSPGGVANFKAFLTEISRIAPTFVVRGNWDAWYWKDIDLFGGTGARTLAVDSAALVVRGTTVAVSGVPVEREHEIKSFMKTLRAEPFNIFLYHYPDMIGEALWGPVDLYCAGHTHGGQVALPFYGALVTLSQFGKRFEAGLYKVKNTWLYVNRGIGMEGGSAPRVRFWARPELTVINVVGEKSGD